MLTHCSRKGLSWLLGSSHKMLSVTQGEVSALGVGTAWQLQETERETEVPTPSRAPPGSSVVEPSPTEPPLRAQPHSQDVTGSP